MKASNFSAANVAEIEANLVKSSENGQKPTLAIVFASPNFDIPALQKCFTEHQIKVVGCTSAGEILNDQVVENSSVCMLLDLDKSAYEIVARSNDGTQIYEAAFSIGKQVKNTFSKPGLLLLSGGIAVDAERLVQGVKDGAEAEIPFFGGLAGDNLNLTCTRAFTNDWISENGLACIVVDSERVEMCGMATSGWEAIGAENEVTAAEGNVLQGINGQPALDVFLKYFGFFDNTHHNGELITSLSAQYPLQIIRESGHSVLRSPMFADFEKRTLTLGAGIEVGQKFRFSIAPGFEVVEKVVEEFSDLQKNAPAADAVLLFSCKGRHAAFGPIIEEEVEGLYNHWNAPMIGFFSYGEIGNTPSGICEFHNETCSLVLLREKN